MHQEYKINKIETCKNSISEFIDIEFEQYFHFSYKDKNIDLQKHMGVSYPVYFNIDDNIHDENNLYFIKENEQPNIRTIVFVNDYNIIMEIFNPNNYNRTYKLRINLQKHLNIKKRILSENYKKIITYNSDSYYMMIDLIYTPNIRAVKINKIKENIKQKNIGYDI